MCKSGRSADNSTNIFSLLIRDGKGTNCTETSPGSVPAGRKMQWQTSTIGYIISNEKYIGDALLQKKYTTDSLTHQRLRNHGEKAKYYFNGCHPAIISSESYNKAQTLVQARKNFKGMSRHRFTHKIACPDCGHFFRCVNSSGRIYWLCPKRSKKETECSSYNLPEEKIVAASRNMLAKLYYYQSNVFPVSLPLLHEIEYTQTVSDSKPYPT